MRRSAVVNPPEPTQSPWVKGYFDIGNHVKYSVVIKDGKPETVYPPEAWIRAYGLLLAKIHYVLVKSLLRMSGIVGRRPIDGRSRLGTNESISLSKRCQNVLRKLV